MTLRLHLDDADESNGALRVIPGSHRLGRLNADEIQHLKTSSEPVVCTVARGGAMLMRPLLLHASSPAVTRAHRHVIHLEFSSFDLPNELAWHY